MKIIIILFLFLLVSCETYPKYSIYESYVLNDSLKSKKLDFITRTMSATNFHLSAGEYNNPEDVVRELNKVFNQTYEEKITGLKIHFSNTNSIRIPKDKLDPNQLVIYNRLFLKK